MKFYEHYIQSLTRRIKEYEESPDPTLLRSNKLYYELWKERAEADLAAWQQGKPLVEARHMGRMLRAMGFQWIVLAQNADRATRFSEYKTVLEKQGFPEKCCDRTVGTIAMCYVGDSPLPRLIMNSSSECDPHLLVDDALAEWHNVPVFTLDADVDSKDEVNLDSLNYISDQLGEFIEWAEKKVPGIKYDKDRHIEIIETDAIGLKFLREIYQLLKHVPCPIVPQDGFTMRREPRRFPNMPRANEYLRVLRDELGERVASGKGQCPEERLRIIWASGANQYGLKAEVNLWRLLTERKVAMPLKINDTTVRQIGLKYAPYGEVSEYGVRLSPLQEEAKEFDRAGWGGSGKRWINDLLDLARDLGTHGIVHHLLVGCTPILGIGGMLAERAEKELGIPVLNIEGRQLDQDYMTQGQFDEILSTFIDKCFDWAGKPRQ